MASRLTLAEAASRLLWSGMEHASDLERYVAEQRYHFKETLPKEQSSRELPERCPFLRKQGSAAGLHDRFAKESPAGHEVGAA